MSRKKEKLVDGTYEHMNWRPIPGYNGMYEISVDGEVRSWNNNGHGRRKEPKIMKPHRQIRGKMTVVLRKDGKDYTVPIAKLMAITFLGGVPDGMLVCHANNDITDNALANIVFMKPEQNRKRQGGHNRKVVLKVDKNGEPIEVYRTMKEAAEKNFMCQYQIYQHCNKRIKNPFKYMDYTFCFEE